MEDTKQKNFSIKTIFVWIIVIIVIVGVGLYCYNKYLKKPEIISYTNGNSTTTYTNSKTKENEVEVKKVYDNITGYYYGTSECIENIFVASYEEFENYVNQFGDIEFFNENDERVNALDYFNNDYFYSHTLAIEAHDASYTNDQYTIDNVSTEGTEAIINITRKSYVYGGPLSPSIEFTFISLDKSITYANFIINTKRINNKWDKGMSFKPIIYLYPTEETEVFVKLENQDKITTSYPQYIDGWKVLANKDGSLKDLLSNKNLYSLYYESENSIQFKIEKDGFIVKGSDTSKFLEEKLALLGLSERESEEFIIYWLPKLEANKYNYIRFATIDEINENIPLEIDPKPDTMIRVLMFKNKN